ncbi:MAG: hypothetical protein ACP5QK_12340 [Myxococcota bacterium]
MYDDEERERPSWREIDKKKDRSRFVREEKPQNQSRKSRAIVVNYKHKLKEAFKSGKVAEAVDKLEGDTPEKKARRENLKILATTEDIGKFSKALKWYLSQNYKDMDADIFNRTLDFENEGLIIEVLEALKVKENLKEILMQKNIVEKLNLLQMTGKSLTLKYLIKELLSKSV